MTHHLSFASAINTAKARVLTAPTVDPGHWQGVPTEGHPDLHTREVLDFSFSASMPQIYNDGIEELAREIQPNLPWADDHFAERVSRVPSNPGEEYVNWPWWRGQDDTTMTNGEFTHTYQERYWPKQAGGQVWRAEGLHRTGIRYFWGDLDDVVTLLFEHPTTRQAWLPIFFPEDTGAVHGGRVPCTLGYQFMMRHDELHMWYVIRSCDYVRHFRDDIYLSARLQLWVLRELQERELRSDKEQVWNGVKPGTFYFHAFSLHMHEGDRHNVY